MGARPQHLSSPETSDYETKGIGGRVRVEQSLQAQFSGPGETGGRVVGPGRDELSIVVRAWATAWDGRST